MGSYIFYWFWCLCSSINLVVFCANNFWQKVCSRWVGTRKWMLITWTLAILIVLLEVLWIMLKVLLMNIWISSLQLLHTGRYFYFLNSNIQNGRDCFFVLMFYFYRTYVERKTHQKRKKRKIMLWSVHICILFFWYSKYKSLICIFNYVYIMKLSLC